MKTLFVFLKRLSCTKLNFKMDITMSMNITNYGFGDVIIFMCTSTYFKPRFESFNSEMHLKFKKSKEIMSALWK